MIRPLAFLLLLASALAAQIYNPKVLREGQVDTTSLAALAEGIYRSADAQTEREKAEAIWRFFLTDGRFVEPGFWYHIAGWAYEEPLGEVLDPLKLLNSYGFGLCYHIAPLLEAAYEAGGFRDARVWFLTGHTVAEVFYDGAYHYYDSDMMGYSCVGKGPPKSSRVASVREIEADGRIILDKLKSPTEVNQSIVDVPWYPADVREAAVGGLTELFTSTEDNWVFPYTRYPQGHTMDFALRPGERLIRYFRPEEDGLYYLPFKHTGEKWKEFPREIERYHIRTEDGPRSQKDKRHWATGRIEYRPGDPESTSPVVFEMPSPYVIIDASISGNVNLASADDDLVVEFSVDQGATWESAATLKGPREGQWQAAPKAEARSEHGERSMVSGTYGYLVRLTTPGSVSDLLLTTRFQLNPRSLPDVRPGHNEFTYSPGTPRRRWPIPVQLDRVEAPNVRHMAEDGQGYLLPHDNLPAELVFELMAPGGEALAGFDVGGRFLDVRNGLAPDKLTAEIRKTSIGRSGAKPAASLSWSTSRDGEFRELWKYEERLAWLDGQPIDRTLRWPEVDRTVTALPTGTKRVYVRYWLEGVALDDVRLAVYTAGESHQGEFEITHVWSENGERKTHVERISQPASAHRYVVNAAPAADIVNHSVIFSAMAAAPTSPRARGLGIPFDGIPGRLNAITDVDGIEVGHTTLIRGEGKLEVGKGPVRTGVTAVLPRGKGSGDPVFAGWFSLNGNGEMTGTTWVEESGFLEGPVTITNTHSVGVVRDAVIEWQVQRSFMQQNFALPVVAETYDGYLNDINGFHVKPEHVFAALDSASGGPVPEGNVGGGTGMNCFEFKGGIGTSSRLVEGEYTVGVLVQANFGRRSQLRIAGVPVGRELNCEEWQPCRATPPREPRDGSIIILVATDAPLLPHQLKRLARRASMGVARTGSISGNGSGDIFIAFSTANLGAGSSRDMAQLNMLPNTRIDPIFEATIQATEEAIINAMVAAETMVGRDGHKSIALPHDEVRRLMKEYNR